MNSIRYAKVSTLVMSELGIDLNQFSNDIDPSAVDVCGVLRAEGMSVASTAVVLYCHYLHKGLADPQYMQRFIPDPNNYVRCVKVIQGWHCAGKIDDITYGLFYETAEAMSHLE